MGDRPHAVIYYGFKFYDSESIEFPEVVPDDPEDDQPIDFYTNFLEEAGLNKHLRIEDVGSAEGTELICEVTRLSKSTDWDQHERLGSGFAVVAGWEELRDLEEFAKRIGLMKYEIDWYLAANYK